MYATPRTQEPVVFFINPFGERKVMHLALAIFIWLMLLVAFRVLRAAMFAEPTVTQIEEVRGLMHLEISDDKS